MAPELQELFLIICHLRKLRNITTWKNCMLMTWFGNRSISIQLIETCVYPLKIIDKQNGDIYQANYMFAKLANQVGLLSQITYRVFIYSLLP